jgi:hypothetical protein
VNNVSTLVGNKLYIYECIAELFLRSSMDSFVYFVVHPIQNIFTYVNGKHLVLLCMYYIYRCISGYHMVRIWQLPFYFNIVCGSIPCRPSDSYKQGDYLDLPGTVLIHCLPDIIITRYHRYRSFHV